MYCLKLGNTMKKIFGVEYDQYKEEGDEPDLSQLTLNFFTRYFL